MKKPKSPVGEPGNRNVFFGLGLMTPRVAKELDDFLTEGGEVLSELGNGGAGMGDIFSVDAERFVMGNMDWGDVMERLERGGKWYE